MLRIDETSKTLVAPEEAALVPEPALDRQELLALLTSGWAAFAGEIGQPHLRFAAASPVAGVDVLAFDEAAGRVAVVSVAAGLGAALAGAAAVSAWDAERLAAASELLAAAVPGDSPRLLLVDAAFDAGVTSTLHWLVRRHGLEASAYAVQQLRFGAERLLDVTRAYPAADGPAPGAPGFFAALAASPAPAGHSAPPPGVTAG